MTLRRATSTHAPVRRGTTAQRPPAAPPTVGPNVPASEAIPILLERHGAMLHGLAMRMCGNRADADDMVQEAFLQAFRKWHTFRGDSDPGTWLYAIAARSCKPRLRRKGGIDRRMPAMSQLLPWRETTVMAIAAAPEGGEDESERAESIARVQGAIARLPEHLRVPLVMKEVLGIRVEDVASALGLAENTIKTRLHRGRLALRKAMIAGAATVDAPRPIFEKQVCLDLLKAKMAAMDRGGVAAGFKVPQAELCARCRAVFREFDLVQDACAAMAAGSLPRRLRDAVLRAIRQRDLAEARSAAGSAPHSAGGQRSTPRRGRPPVKGSPGAARGAARRKT